MPGDGEHVLQTQRLRGRAMIALWGITLVPIRAAAEPLRLEDVLAIARNANPEIQAARSRAHAAEAVPPQARAWDDPVVSWEAWNAPTNMNDEHAGNKIYRDAQE